MLLTNQSQGFLYARWATVGLALPILLYYMTVPNQCLWVNNPQDILMALARPSALFTASKKIGRILEGWGMTDVRPVYHGTPPQPMEIAQLLEAQATLAGLGVLTTDPVILLAGRLQRWKGQHLLVEALPSVLQACPQAHAVFLGGTLFGQSLSYPQQLQKVIADLSLEHRVHLVGHRPIRGWLERASVVIHYSTTPDPFPNVCIEALAARRPLITNTLSGTAEILRNGIDALVIEPNAPAALADAIVELLADPERAANLAEAGHRRYLETCTPTHMVRPIEEALTSFVKAPVLSLRQS